MSELPIVRKSKDIESTPSSPPLRKNSNIKYDKGFEVEKDNTFDVPYNPEEGDERFSRDKWITPGKAANTGISLGMPASINASNGGALGCGCVEAFLHGVGDIIDGTIEADYVCDFGYHNYVIFELEQMGKRSGLQVDKNGNLIETQEVGHADDGLEEY